MRVDKLLTAALGVTAGLSEQAAASSASPAHRSAGRELRSGLPTNGRVATSSAGQAGRVSLPKPGQLSESSLHAASFSAPASLDCNTSTGGRAAQAFQRDFATTLKDAPMGSVRATRDELGLRPHDFVMVDLGGEGQKTAQDGLKSGNLHAINVNQEATISPGQMWLQTDPDDPKAGRSVSQGAIPNLIQINAWPDRNAASAEGLIPLAKGFSNLTVMEGAPFYQYHAAELDRVTSPGGWIALSVDSSFKPDIDRLAAGRNGGEVWHLAKGSPQDNDRYIVPPPGLSATQAQEFKAELESTGPHQIYDVMHSISQRISGGQGPRRDEL